MVDFSNSNILSWVWISWRTQTCFSCFWNPCILGWTISTTSSCPATFQHEAVVCEGKASISNGSTIDLFTLRPHNPMRPNVHNGRLAAKPIKEKCAHPETNADQRHLRLSWPSSNLRMSALTFEGPPCELAQTSRSMVHMFFSFLEE